VACESCFTHPALAKISPSSCNGVAGRSYVRRTRDGMAGCASVPHQGDHRIWARSHDALLQRKFHCEWVSKGKVALSKSKQIPELDSDGFEFLGSLNLRGHEK
jgi:hypothetical protein